ncbi:MAG TPA: hypothetical protein VIX73_21500, partial [Kofleriaceae bacterium]
GAGARQPITAATCWIALAHAARGRGELDVADDLLRRARTCLTGAARNEGDAAALQLAAALAEVLGDPPAAGASSAAAPRARRRSDRSDR